MKAIKQPDPKKVWASDIPSNYLRVWFGGQVVGGNREGLELANKWIKENRK